ncbi:hypothetical protein AJ80_02447 [Polytolypa hystricis UAMH7299]|uniref:Uncharacterized protein n=1 Tax=Polytolypa hystricis (strain UAMH7299) TaxID=1447883 RepID=A0A2B7YR68_POLH7|nr:hypothetical protein AJ80_02447 [Polytolypa hystricis UAMH7299]
MSPDLNSLPPSRSTSVSPFQSRTLSTPPEGGYTQSLSPRSSSVSLAAAATMNAADRSRRSSFNPSSPQGRAHERRRSVVAMNFNMNDPTIPGPGELPSSDHRASIGNAFRTASPATLGGSPTISTGDPHHHRTPSLGELHQELEQEQEAQVNRLLLMIRTQQHQLQQLQQHQQPQGSASGTAIADDSTPTSERSVSFSSIPPPLPIPRRRSSVQRRASSQAGSPYLQPMNDAGSIDWSTLGGGDISGRRNSRDESAFYQAETATLTRENQMLRLRIRELERQIGDLKASSAHAPATSSQLASSPESAAPTPSGSEAEQKPEQPAEAEKP